MVQESPRLRTSPAPGLPCYCTTGRRGPPIGTIFPSMTKKKGWCSAGSKKRKCRCSGGIGWTLAAPLGHVIPKLGGVAVRSALSPAWTGFRRFKVRVDAACATATLYHTNLMGARRRHGWQDPNPKPAVTIPAPQWPPARVTEERNLLRAMSTPHMGHSSPASVFMRSLWPAHKDVCSVLLGKPSTQPHLHLYFAVVACIANKSFAFY